MSKRHAWSQHRENSGSTLVTSPRIVTSEAATFAHSRYAVAREHGLKHGAEAAQHGGRVNLGRVLELKGVAHLVHAATRELVAAVELFPVRR